MLRRTNRSDSEPAAGRPGAVPPGGIADTRSRRPLGLSAPGRPARFRVPPDQEVIDGIDARDTWTTYKVSLRTGKIIWRLGGKDSSFATKAAPGQVLESAGEAFAVAARP